MQILFHIGVISTSLFALWFASEKTVQHVMVVARFLGLSDLFIGFAVLSIATGLPELSITLQSLLAGVPNLSFGTTLGASITVLSLCLGLAAAFWGPLQVSSRESKKYGLFVLASALWLIVLLMSGVVYWYYGFFLILIFITGLWFLWLFDMPLAESQEIKVFTKKEAYASTVYSVVALTGVLFFSKIAVESALLLINGYNIAHEIVGVLVMSLGSSLPELSLNVQAARKKKFALVIGNTLGSVFEQCFLILGIMALGLSEPLSVVGFRYVWPFLLGIFSLITYGLVGKKRISKGEGIVLLCLYSFFIIYTILVYKGS